MPSPTQPNIQRLEPWKHGPAVLKLFAEDFGDFEAIDTAATDDFALAGLVEIDDSVGFVWVEDDEVLGAIICLPNPGRKDTWIIANLVTNARFRRRGIGRALLGAAIRFIEQKGAEYVALQVDKKNTSAIALYRRTGFKIIGEMVHYTMTPQTLLRPVRHMEFRRANQHDAEIIWQLATAIYPETLGFAEPLDREWFQLKQPRFWQRKPVDMPMVFVNVTSPPTSAILVRDELLDGVRRRLELRPVFDTGLSAADGAGLVVNVLRALALEMSDVVVAISPDTSLIGQLALDGAMFAMTNRFVHMRKTNASTLTP
jgi:ribosomal protein S18 acetylase RimI-like enzyme